MTDDSMRYHGGLAAEELAADRYRRAGAEILASRARTAGGEIDLIARLDGLIIFIEVKQRRRHAAAAQSVSEQQQARIYTAAEVWLAENGYSSLAACRFDVVTVDAAGTLEVIENAYGAA